MTKLKKNKHICGTCKHYEDCLNASGGIDVINKNNTCEDWESDDFTEEHKRRGK